MKKSLFLAIVLVSMYIFAGQSGFAQTNSENWVKVHGNLYIDVASMFTDVDGYTHYKSHELDNQGVVMYQHKEAIHCGKAMHYFLKMYGATDILNNRDYSDAWEGWKDNPREVYNIDRLYAIKSYVCGTLK